MEEVDVDAERRWSVPGRGLLRVPNRDEKAIRDEVQDCYTPKRRQCRR